MKMSHLRTQLVNNGTMKVDPLEQKRASMARAIASRRLNVHIFPIVTTKRKSVTA